METIINDPELHFLKFNNSITKTQKITKEMLNSKNELFINFDLSNVPDNKILAIYWKFYNLDIENCYFLLCYDNYFNNYREFNYYSLIKSYQFLDKMLNGDEVNKNNYKFMESFALHPTEIFEMNNSSLRNDVSINLKVKNEKDDFVINENSYIEYVIQHKLNFDNLPENLEVLKIYDLDRIFTNLPIGLRKIIIYNKHNYFTNVEKIKECFPKIPFGCKIVNEIGQEIYLD